MKRFVKDCSEAGLRFLLRKRRLLSVFRSVALLVVVVIVVLSSLVLVLSSSLWHRCMSVVYVASVRSFGDRVFFFCGEL